MATVADKAGKIPTWDTRPATDAPIPPKSKGAAVVDYSTTEQDTGVKWINGKNIFRKVIDVGALPSSATSKVVAHGIPVISAVVRTFGIMTDGTNYAPLPYYSPNDLIGVVLVVDTTSVTVIVGQSRSAYTAKVVIEYTK